MDACDESAIQNSCNCIKERSSFPVSDLSPSRQYHQKRDEQHEEGRRDDCHISGARFVIDDTPYKGSQKKEPSYEFGENRAAFFETFESDIKTAAREKIFLFESAVTH